MYVAVGAQQTKLFTSPTLQHWGGWEVGGTYNTGGRKSEEAYVTHEGAIWLEDEEKRRAIRS